ncbi:MAG: hypothetical protein ABIR68_05465, partial [Ilumatobacteraceae bacterium]
RHDTTRHDTTRHDTTRCEMNRKTSGPSDPAFLSVIEAAGIFGISRSLAYQSANEYLATGGRFGLRCIRLGGRVLIPRSYLEGLADGKESGTG